MRATSLGEIVLDRGDQERLSKLLEWAAQFVVSIEHVTVQGAAQFIQDWKAATQTQVDNEAIRCARLARSLLTWDDARTALAVAIGLLNKWEKTQPHPHTVS